MNLLNISLFCTIFSVGLITQLKYSVSTLGRQFGNADISSFRHEVTYYFKILYLLSTHCYS